MNNSISCYLGFKSGQTCDALSQQIETYYSKKMVGKQEMNPACDFTGTNVTKKTPKGLI